MLCVNNLQVFTEMVPVQERTVIFIYLEILVGYKLLVGLTLR